MNTQPELNTKDIRTVAIILITGILVVMLCLVWASRTMSQEKVKEYKLTEVQLLKLQVVQKDAMLLKAQMQDIQRQFGDKIADLQRTAEKIKLENSWPPETRFDMDSLQFSAPKEEKK